MSENLKWIRAGAAALLLAGAGCATHRESESASSGDPAADQRANQRIGASGATNDKTPVKTLYERVGGQEGISALVEDMMNRSINDPRVNFDRSGVKTSILGRKYPTWEASAPNVDTLKKHMVEFLALASGGPAEYTGHDVREVHKGMRISNSEFDAMVGDVKASMDRLGWAVREKRDMLAIVETTRKEIVEK